MTPATVSPEVMAAVDWCIQAQRNVSFRERSQARSDLLAAIAAAIEAARRDAMREIRDADWDDGI